MLSSISVGTVTLEQRAQWIADRYGADACAIVVGLVRELNLSLESALDMAVAGDASFRKACEKHLAALRSQVKRDREELVREQRRADETRRRESLDVSINAISMMIEEHEVRRRMALAHVRVQPTSSDVCASEIARVTAELDVERAALHAQLDAAVAARDADAQEAR